MSEVPQVSEAGGTLRRLSADQALQFNTRYLRDEREQAFLNMISDMRPDEVDSLRVLDVGGGNGQFADYLLQLCPGASVTILDPSTELLERNTEIAGKRLVVGGAEEMLHLFESDSFHLINFNWILHHLVGSSIDVSRKAQQAALPDSLCLLVDGGRISVFENCFESSSKFGSQVLFRATSIGRPKALAGLMRKLGANTAGVGVLFRSSADWEAQFKQCGLAPLSSEKCDRLSYPRIVERALGISEVRVTHYSLAAR